MVTRNWYNAFKAFNGQKVITEGLKDTSGVVRNAGYPYNSPPLTFSFISTNYSKSESSTGIALGSGITPATVYDYKLESMITSGLSVSISRSNDEDNNIVFIFTITNTSASDITIGEVGVIQSSNTSAGGGTAYVMTERTVLDSPIAIPAGGIGQVTYTIRLNYPTT